MENRILSVLVVDDDLLIREELRMFNWEAYHTVLVGDVSNGQEALDFCRNYTPDIVITDITMPVMDGMELLKRLKDEFPLTKVVILTCYGEFTYAKEALQFGAIDYVMKVTMDMKEIGIVLQKACEAIEKERLIHKSEKEIKRLNLSKVFVGLFLEQDVDSQFILKKMREYSIDVQFPTRQVFLFVDSKPGDWIFIDPEIQDILDNEPDILNWILLSTGEFAIYLKDKSLDKKEIANLMQSLIGVLYEGIRNRISFVSSEVRIYAVISSIVHSSESFLNLYRELNYWKDLSFYNIESNIFSDTPGTFNKIDRKAKSEFYNLLDNFKVNEDGIYDFVKIHLKEWAVKMMPVPDDLKSFIIEWFNSFNVKTDDEKTGVRMIWRARNIYEMIDRIVHEIELKKGRQEGYRPDIKKAIELIKQKYNQPISLSGIAEEVKLSSQYLSRLFSEEVGESFNEFVTRVRMEYAEKLLRESNLKVYEVAENVGIPNYKYFTALFKSWTGKSPKEFKKE